MVLPATKTKAELLKRVESFDVAAYAKTRNHLSGSVSKLSRFITRGVITLPEIRQVVLKRYSVKTAEKYIQELAWREYWQRVWEARGEDIFSDLRFPRDDWVHTDLVSAITEAKTGIAVIDAAIRELYETGYMHNHARMWTAMPACNVRKGHWYPHSRWLYYHLYDGDLASNMLSWQWVAGTNASKRYVANQAVIHVCSNETEPRTYLTMPREEVGNGPIPEPLLATTPFEYHTRYGESDTYDRSAMAVFLYSPWTLNPDWRADEPGERILLIEPRWFDRFPVSSGVLEFITTVARTQIPSIKIVYANAKDVLFFQSPPIRHLAHPTHAEWPGIGDEPDRLFPSVSGYYPSFFSYWRACQRSM